MLLTNNVEFLLLKFAVDVSRRLSQAMNDQLICKVYIYIYIYEEETFVLVCLIEIINF